ncbi:response regulator transcription factor [Pelagibius sp. Alg239-R121]|uniref:response regulator transcription factor n=1 Tax=Pelagibius sp. Alg239-R121 TaxID=2993448 RepID=UPI0024A6C113|nr:response regulator [Pelagibius sp. Alg239-R121]
MATILLIDDMNGVRSSLTTVLTTAGHQVVEAADGEVGLQKAGEQSFDLVITDIIMPKVDGSEVILALKTRSQTLPILAISGGGATVNAEKALMLARSTADAVLSKPFSRGDLLQAVDELVGPGIADVATA